MTTTSRGTRVRRSTKALVIAPVMLTASILFVANSWADESTTSSEANVPQGFNSVADVPAEYKAALEGSDLRFPRGIELPSITALLTKNVAQSAPGPVFFEDGFGESVLVGHWRCAWERTYVNAANAADGDALRVAGKELSGYHDLDLVKKHVHDPQHLWQRDVVDPALSGNLEPMQDDLTNNCDPIFLK